MSHSVSCDTCNATFAIPDEVWEKRVEGQLATLKCRHCKAPIQIDGRAAKRNVTPPTETKAVAGSKASALGSATTGIDAKTSTLSNAAQSAKNEGAGSPAAKRAQVATGAGKVETANALVAPVATVASHSREQPKPTAVSVEQAKEPAATGSRTRSAAAETAMAHHASRDKLPDTRAVKVRSTTGSLPNTFAKREDEGATKDTTHTAAKSADADAAHAREASPHATSTSKASAAVPAITTKNTLAAKTFTAADSAPEPRMAADRASLAKSDSSVREESSAGEPAPAPPVKSIDSDWGDVALEQPLAKVDTPQSQTESMTPVPVKATAKPRGGGPPPLRKSAASTPDIGNTSPQERPIVPEAAAPERHGPPPLPRQSSVHDAEPVRRAPIVEPRDEAARVHSPASMPVVAAMAVPFAGRTSSLAPRPSDIAALVKIRPKFPKWLPFAVLGAAVVLVAALAALSWFRGDTPAEKTASTAVSSALPLPATTSAFASAKLPTTSTGANETGSESRSTSAEFASQFAQAAAKQRPTTQFDRVAAEKALAASFAKAASCHNKGDPIGLARVTISIAPSGQILSVTVAPPFAGTFTADCIRNALMEAKSEPFQGAPGRLVHSISIR